MCEGSSWTDWISRGLTSEGSWVKTTPGSRPNSAQASRVKSSSVDVVPEATTKSFDSEAAPMSDRACATSSAHNQSRPMLVLPKAIVLFFPREISRKPEIIFWVTNAGPRRGDSWLVRIAFLAGTPNASR